MRLRAIGFWRPIDGIRDEESDRLPDVSCCVDETWCTETRQLVADYLSQGFVLGYSMGYSACRFCRKQNGSVTLTDGFFLWPEGLAHYLLEHGVRLPIEVEREILKRIDEIEGAAMDMEWWIELFRKP